VRDLLYDVSASEMTYSVYCVGWGVKLYSLTHSLTHSLYDVTNICLTLHRGVTNKLAICVTYDK